jgi:hypothetical protein
MFSKLIRCVFCSVGALFITGVITVAEASKEVSCPEMPVGRTTIVNVRVKGINCEDVWQWVLAAFNSDGGQSKIIDDNSYRLVKGSFKSAVITKSLIPVIEEGPRGARISFIMKKGGKSLKFDLTEGQSNITD